MTAHRSPWQRSGGNSVAKLDPLERDLAADVCVIGAGIAGLLCALELTERGHSVIVLERQGIAAGDTAATTAHLTTMLDTRYFTLAEWHGAEAARRIATSHMRGIAHLERVANTYGIECGFRRVSGFLCAANAEQAQLLAREHSAATAAGISCELVRRPPLPLGEGPALHVPHQAELEPLAFLDGVAQQLERQGVPIFAPVTVQSFDAVSASDEVALKTSRGFTVRARHVVVATGTPINDVALLHTKLAAYRSYGVAAGISGLVPALAWDLEEPYHYARTALDAATGRPVLLVGGEDHRVGQDLDNEQRFSRLTEWLRARFPDAGEIVSQWSGQVFESSDGLGFIGRNPGQERVLVLAGFSGNGTSYSGLAAELIADLVQGLESPCQSLYDPARKPSSLGAVTRFVRENLNVVGQYSDWLGPADVARSEDIPRGQGAVLRRGVRRVAVYVDELGLNHELSASCPHLGGVVAWNAAEKSWDCPCHGSRFDPYGKVMEGPAVCDLQPLSSAPSAKVGKAS